LEEGTHGGGERKRALRADDLRVWLRDETRRVLKAAELQLRDATEFVTDYALGRITSEEVDDRMSRYGARWGESRLVAAMPHENTPDEEILRRLDEEHEHGLKKWQERTLPGSTTPRSL
jgi:hypothetical protein